MLDFKKFFGSMWLSISSKLSKKAYKNGLVIISACIITVLFLGVNGFGVTTLNNENSVKKITMEEEDTVEKDELLLSEEEDEVFSIQSNVKPQLFVSTPSLIEEKEKVNMSELEANIKAENEDITDKSTAVANKDMDEPEAEHILQKEEEVGKELAVANIQKSIYYSEKDYDALLKIVEAEATGEDVKGKIMVANVILNRMSSKRFPNQIYKVIHQKLNNRAQFSPIDDGRYYTVKVTNSTIEAVERALKGEDYSDGALFFVARSLATDSAVSWFDKNLDKVAEHGCHEFFKYR